MRVIQWLTGVDSVICLKGKKYDFRDALHIIHPDLNIL